MKLTDERQIAADPHTVWAAILDADVLRACVPGCQEMTGSAADGFTAVVVQKVGPVKARFTGAVTLSEMIEAQSLHIAGEGKGGVAGFAKGGAHVTLSPSEGGTQLAYTVEANVGGKLAQLGNRIIDGFARKMADEFFARLQKAIEGEPDEMPVATAEGQTDAPVAVKKTWLKRITG